MGGFWDVFTLAKAVYHIAVKRNIQKHRHWMIVNFSVGAGSIWVRVFGAVWAACDLTFMRKPEMFGLMNGYALIGGFYYGAMFGEWWLAHGRIKKRLEWLMALVCLWVAVMGKRMYRKQAEKDRSIETKITGCPVFLG